jgi:DNA ligase-associated metallophosphoesterase
MEFIYRNITLKLLPEKAIWLPRESTLLLADIHLGKSAHFRKNGLPVSQQIEYQNYKILEKLIFENSPTSIYFLGDLFHSTANEDWEIFNVWRKFYRDIQMVLVKGNHDILPHYFYQNVNLEVVNEGITLNNIQLWHHPPQIDSEMTLLHLYGHIHPSFLLKGKGRQKLKLPCFYLTNNSLAMPAFGHFTGTKNIEPKKSDRIFVCLPNLVSEIKF